MAAKGKIMHLHIHGMTFDLTSALVRHVEQQVEFALGPAAAQLKQVTVRLGDVNGLRGGVDQRCHLLIEPRGLSPVVVQAVDVDMYAAIDRAFGRAKLVVRRHLQRRRTLRRDFPRRRQVA